MWTCESFPEHKEGGWASQATISPASKLFLSPDWRGTKGIYYADQPSYRNGNYVKSVTLTFEKGKVVRSEAAKGVVSWPSRWQWTSGRKGRGVLPYGQEIFKNRPIMANTLFDENYGGKNGNCHLHSELPIPTPTQAMSPR